MRSGANALPDNLRELFLGGPLGRRILPELTYILSLFPRSLRNFTRSIGHIITTFPPWHSLPSLEIWIMLIAVGLGVLAALGLEEPLEPEAVKIRLIPVARRAAEAAFGVAIVLAFPLGLLLLLYRHQTATEMMTFFHMGSSARLLLLLPILWQLTSVPYTFSAPLDVSRSISPAEVLRLDRQATLLVVLLEKASRAALIWWCCGPEIALAYSLYGVTCIVCKILLGGTDTAAAFFADARIWLACGRRMPWRTMTFLIDAKERGVLRQVSIHPMHAG